MHYESNVGPTCFAKTKQNRRLFQNKNKVNYNGTSITAIDHTLS